MTAAPTTTSRILGPLAWLAALPGRLVGPIFAKELRVSSRRRRNFVLRLVYLILLMLVLSTFWARIASLSIDGSHAFRVARMAVMGRMIVVTIVWFQFVVGMLVTIIMLSTSISEEVRGRTLGVLMCTPITSVQVVVGKLLSKMFQLIVLLATSLPLLAVVRVFGGVPWRMVISALCITLSTGILVGSVTIFYSIYFRRAYASILLTIGTLAVLYLGLPLLVGLSMLVFEVRSLPLLMDLVRIWTYVNPFMMLTYCTAEFGLPGGLGVFHWWINCLITLGLASVVLAICVRAVRRVALREAVGGGRSGRIRPKAPAIPPPVVAAPRLAGVGAPPLSLPLSPPRRRPVRSSSAVRAIHGSPVVWRELRPARRRGWLPLVLGICLIALLLAIYAALAHLEAFDEGGVHAMFMALYTVVGTLVAIILSATNIAGEKEARCWEILLATPLSDWHIVGGKAVGVFRRCLPVWTFPMAHLLLFLMLGMAHPVLLFHMTLVAVSVIGFFGGSGLYFGVRFKRTSTAAVMNLALALAIWLGPPLLLGLASEILPNRVGRDLWETTAFLADSSPIMQAGIVTAEASGDHLWRWGKNQLSYRWPGAGRIDAAETTAYLLLFTTGYLALGALFAWRAACRLRKHLF